MINDKIKNLALELVEEVYKLAQADVLRKMGEIFELEAKPSKAKAAKENTGSCEIPVRRVRRKIRKLRKGVQTTTSKLAELNVGDKLPFPEDKQPSFRAAVSRIAKAQRKRFQKDGAYLVRVA